MDSETISIGEKGHLQYDWSHCIKNRFVQFQFQMTRTDSDGINMLENILRTMMEDLIKMEKTDNETYKLLLMLLYKTISYTRDIIDGKGEYMLAYMMIFVFYEYFPEAALYALHRFVDCGIDHQYGSWKDMKYFCNYCYKTRGLPPNHPLIQFAIDLMSIQLKNDIYNEKNISLVAKWIPREKSKKFGWIFDELALNYYPEYHLSAKNSGAKVRAFMKSKRELRKIITRLNSNLDTIQIKQCHERWCEIDHSKITSLTMVKQRESLLNLTKTGSIRSDQQDRMQCANNIKYSIEIGDFNVKGERVSMHEFTREAFNIKNMISHGNISSDNIKTQYDILNQQWKNSSATTPSLKYMIPMIDVSESMNGEPCHAAISLGIRVAENSVLGKRILTFGQKPCWINLEHCDNFTDYVKAISQVQLGGPTNFYEALEIILESIIENKLPPDMIENLTIVIFSDHQIQKDNHRQVTTMYNEIESLYKKTGSKPPHILFWNLRSTNGFPSLSNQNRVSMVSGYSPSILNLFCEGNSKGKVNYTPWDLYINILGNKRYSIMEEGLSL